MKKQVQIFLILLILTPLLIFSQINLKKKVYFVGNSYTSSNNLTNIIKQVASSVGDTLYYEEYSPGGADLQSHSVNSVVLDKIGQGGWDFVVLQEQSQRSAIPQIYFITDVLPYASTLNDKIIQANPCGETMFYMIWGAKNGELPQFTQMFPYTSEYETLDSAVTANYLYLTEKLNGVVSPVGVLWNYIRKNYSSINLYSSDGRHPSASGSYAAACSFYSVIFKKDPSLITYDFTLSSSEAETIRKAAKLIVYDSLINWSVGKYDINAKFTSTVNPTDSLSYDFMDNSDNSVNRIWKIDTFLTSSEVSVSYTFPQNGDYIISLTSYNNCGDTSKLVDTIRVFKSIPITSVQKNNDFNNDFNIFPNPSNGNFVINTHNNFLIKLEIFDITGVMVFSDNFKNTKEFNLSNLKSGIYILNFKNQFFRKNYKLIIKK